MHSHGDLKVKILWPRLKSMKEEAFDEKELQAGHALHCSLPGSKAA